MFNGYSRSANTYTTTYKYSFSLHSERITLNPINIYESNDFIESLFVPATDNDIPVLKDLIIPNRWMPEPKILSAQGNVGREYYLFKPSSCSP